MSAILLVEDDRLVRETLCHQLSMKGHQVTAVEHGGDGLEALRNQSFDLLLTDLLMPDVDGIALIHSVRKEGYGLPILAMSGGSTVHRPEDATLQVDYLDMSVKLGATATLRKPFSPATLLGMIEELLAM